MLDGDDNGGNETNWIELGKFDRIMFSGVGSDFYVRMLLLNSARVESLSSRSNDMWISRLKKIIKQCFSK